MTLAATPVEALFELERELAEPPFMGVAIGSTLSDVFLLGLWCDQIRLTLKEGLLGRARYHYRFCRGMPPSPVTEGLTSGRVLVTSIGSRPHLLDLVLPVVWRLGPDGCAVIGHQPSLSGRVPNGVPLLSWGNATSSSTRKWSTEYKRCTGAWHGTVKSWIRRWGLPRNLFLPLAYELLIQSLRVAGSLELLGRLKPSAVVTEYDRNALASCLILGARSLGIPTMTMIHGVISPPYGYTPLLADVAFCWGEQQREVMLRLGTPPHRLAVTGCQRMSQRVTVSSEDARARVGLPPGRPMVMLGSSPMHNSMRRPFARAFCQALGLRRDISAVVRLHPSERSDFYRAEIAAFPDVRFIESRFWPVAEALSAAEVVVCQDSGLGSEALVAGRFTVVLDVLGDRLGNGRVLVEEAGCPLARSPEELASEVTRTLGDNQYRAQLAAFRERFVERFCAAFGDAAAERIVSEIAERAASATSTRGPQAVCW